MTISNWIWKGIKNIAKLILGIIVVVAFVTFFIVPFLHNSIDRTLAQWIWYPAVSISILFFVIDNIRSKRPAFKTPIIDFLSKWGEISVFPVFVSLFVFNYYEIKYIWMWVLFGIAAIFILAFFLSLLMFYIRINQLSEEEKHTSVMNIMKSILLCWFIDLLYMSIFNDWLIPTFIFGVLAIVIVFFNLVKAFLYGAKILHFLIALEMIIALALSGYLIFIIPNESLQEIVLSIVAALYGGILTLVGVAWTIKDSNEKRQEDFKRIEDARKEEERKKLALYNECLDRKFSNFDLTEKVVNAQNELTNYIKNNYNASVSYFDFTYGFSYDYNQDNVYYAASTTKSLVALYIYTQAAEGKINLDDTITYLSKYKVSYSAGVSKHKIGSKIKIRDLVKYSVIYSDNSAHQMLVSYIGRGKLKEFGKNLGAKNTLNGGDNFGNISSADGIIYMNAVNNFIENNGELGEELKKFFVSSQQNEISVNNLDVAHKYGLYKNYYHNMGIVYDEKPYVVSIMTLHGNKKNKEKVISDLSNKVYELHNLFKVNREEVCNLEVYANEKSASS